MTSGDPIDWSKSLQELDGVDWGHPEGAETPMIGRVLALRRKPLEDFTNDEVRLAVGQRAGFPYVLELAIQRLRRDPLLEGDYYPGDILAALTRVDEAEWLERPDLRAELSALFRQAMERSDDDAEAFRDAMELPSSDRRAN